MTGGGPRGACQASTRQRGRPGLAQTLGQEEDELLKPGAWGQDPGFATRYPGTLGQWFTLLQPRLLIWLLSLQS